MAIALIVFLVLSAASAAPTSNDGMYKDWQKDPFDTMDIYKLQEVYPAKRSNYGYVTPCAAAATAAGSYAPAMAASSAIPGYAPAPAAMPHSYSHASYQQVPVQYGHASSHYSHPYYRMGEENGNEHEIMGFSDMEPITMDNMPMARYAYGGAPTPVADGSAGVAPAASTPVVAVFSNVGGHSVPLLVSCSPSITHGRMVKAHRYYDSASGQQQGNTYRVVEEHQHEEAQGNHPSLSQSAEHTTHNSKTTVENHQ